eukprot:1156692-Pelagomonas_calceolata.AAC.3
MQACAHDVFQAIAGTQACRHAGMYASANDVFQAIAGMTHDVFQASERMHASEHPFSNACRHAGTHYVPGLCKLASRPNAGTPTVPGVSRHAAAFCQHLHPAPDVARRRWG